MAIQIEKRLFLAPSWMDSILQRHSLSLNAILDLDVLFKITSPNDLATLSLLNTQTSRIFGKDIQMDSLVYNWTKNTDAWARYVNQIEPLKALVQVELEERLYDKASLDPKYPNPFEIKDIDFNTLLVIIYPGYFGNEQSARYQDEITRAVLKLLYAYEGYDNMARRVIFENYLQKL